jgi:hypothetical protein
MRSILCAAMLTLMITPAAAAEDTHSANYWLPRCKGFISGTTTDYAAGICAGMVEGIGFASPDVCIPDPVTRSQAVQVVVR